MSDNNDFDVDSLLDATLDDLEDLPEFKPFPPGAHRAIASLELKDVNGKKAVELSLKAVETIQLAEPTKDTPLAAGDEASVLFMLDNAFGRGNMKRLLRPIGESLGVSGIRDIIAQTQDVEVVVLTVYRRNQNDPSSPYMNVKELQVV